MDNIAYGSRIDGRNDLLAVVQNLNCIASPGKVCEIFYSSILSNWYNCRY